MTIIMSFNKPQENKMKIQEIFKLHKAFLENKIKEYKAKNDLLDNLSKVVNILILICGLICLIVAYINFLKLEGYPEKSDILKCLKSCLKYNKNTIDYNEINELVNSNNIIGNNFWNEDNFEDICRFEYRDYFDFSECKFKYI